MGNINRVPKGLLSLLDSQTQGKNPDTMSDTVSPVYDMGPSWLLSKGYEIVTFSSAPVVAVGGYAQGFTVPDGELWAVYQVTTRVVNLDAFDSHARCSVGFQLNGSTPYIALAKLGPEGVQLASWACIPPTETNTAMISFPVPFFAPAGSSFLGHVAAVMFPPAGSAVNLVFDTYAVIVRLRV